MGRRELIRSAALGAAGLGMCGLPFGVLAQTGDAVPQLSPSLLARAGAALATHSDLINSREVMAIADFSQPSRLPRFFLYNLIDGRTTSMLVSHGRGSDPAHSGWLQNFSNVPGSAASSSGAYVAGAQYFGQHGEARRLIGLEPQNDQAENRAIVIHSAWYVSPSIAVEQGKIGRSEGCFAFSFDDIGQVLARLPQGSLLYADKIEAV